MRYKWHNDHLTEIVEITNDEINGYAEMTNIVYKWQNDYVTEIVEMTNT